MHIITFIGVLLASLGALFVGAKVFAFSFIALAKVFLRIGLFLWNKFAVPAMRPLAKPEVTQVQEVAKPEVTQVQEVAKPEVTQVQEVAKPEVTQVQEVAKPEVTQVQEVAKPEVTQEPDWAYLEIPTYLRKGKKIVWS